MERGRFHSLLLPPQSISRPLIIWSRVQESSLASRSDSRFTVRASSLEGYHGLVPAEGFAPSRPKTLALEASVSTVSPIENMVGDQRQLLA